MTTNERRREPGKCDHCHDPRIDAALLEPTETADHQSHWVCAALECQAFITWTDDRWFGAARMARSRHRDQWTPIDEEAVRRQPDAELDHYLLGLVEL